MVYTVTNIANSALKPADIPGPRATWELVQRFALTFDGYEQYGSFERCAKIGNEALAKFRASRRLPDSLDELRTALFFEQRRWRHFGTEPDKETWTYLRALLRAIRKQIELPGKANSASLEPSSRPPHGAAQIVRSLLLEALF